MESYQEGDIISFNVGKTTVTPDNEIQYVLSAPDGRKFLLPYRYYSNYKIEPGDKLRCRVDRINCNGAVFLEPENPFYTEGKSYFFTVKGSELRKDTDGNDLKILNVSDRWGNLVAVETGGRIPAPGARKKLLVERVLKGRLILRGDSARIRRTSLLPGKEYEFRVEGSTVDLDNHELWIVCDSNGKRHFMPKRYYITYGLGPGDSFRGKVVKLTAAGEAVIEPENPYFREGSEVVLKVNDVKFNEFSGLYSVDLLDLSGNRHCIEMGSAPLNKSLKCRVVRIRKGKPQFEII